MKRRRGDLHQPAGPCLRRWEHQTLLQKLHGTEPERWNGIQLLLRLQEGADTDRRVMPDAWHITCRGGVRWAERTLRRLLRPERLEDVRNADRACRLLLARTGRHPDGGILISSGDALLLADAGRPQMLLASTLLRRRSRCEKHHQAGLHWQQTRVDPEWSTNIPRLVTMTDSATRVAQHLANGWQGELAGLLDAADTLSR